MKAYSAKQDLNEEDDDSQLEDQSDIEQPPMNEDIESLERNS